MKNIFVKFCAGNWCLACHSCLDTICQNSPTLQTTQKALDCYDISMAREANDSSSLHRGFEALNSIFSQHPDRVAKITEQGMEHPANDTYSLEYGKHIINKFNDRNSLQEKNNTFSRMVREKIFER